MASSVCKSLQYLTSALTQGVEGGHLFRLTCSVVLRGGRNTANKYHWCVWGLRIVSGSHWVCPHSQSVCFPGLHCSGSRLLCQLTIYGGPWVACTSHIYAVQVLGYRLSWACVLCALFVPFPGQSSSGNQVLGERTLPRCGASYHLPSPSCSVSWVVYCVSLLGS